MLAWGLQRRFVFSSKSYNALLHPDSIEILKMHWGNRGFPVISRGRWLMCQHTTVRGRGAAALTPYGTYILTVKYVANAQPATTGRAGTGMGSENI